MHGSMLRPDPPGRVRTSAARALLNVTVRKTALLPLLAVPLVVGACGSNSKSATKPKALTEQQLIANAGPGTVEITDKVGHGEFGGTGFVINAQKGLILTNDHVVNGASSIKVLTNKKTEVNVQILAEAPCDDLAVLRMTSIPAGTTALTFGASGAVKAGENVTVLGYPETLGSGEEPHAISATTGIVSNPNTSASLGAGSIKYPALIQHQAFINHGNSGGPLLDSEGKVVGINTLSAAGSGAGGQLQGQYYSITSAQAQSVLPKLESGQSIADWGWKLTDAGGEETKLILENVFGAQANAAVQAFVSTFPQGTKPEGLVVLGVNPGSPATAAKMNAGDYVSEINGTPVTSIQGVCEVAQSAPSGSTIKIDGRFLAGPIPEGSHIGDGYTTNLKAP